MGFFALVEMILFIVAIFIAYFYVLRRGGLDSDWQCNQPGVLPEMGVEEKLPSGVLLTTLENLFGYMRSAAFWPATFGLACCAIEMMATGGAHYDISAASAWRSSAPRRARPTS